MNKKADRKIIITEGELHQLLFWSHVGTYYTISGSYQKSIPTVIVKYAKQLKLSPKDFSLFKHPPTNRLAEDVLQEWNEQHTKKGKRL